MRAQCRGIGSGGDFSIDRDSQCQILSTGIGRSETAQLRRAPACHCRVTPKMYNHTIVVHTGAMRSANKKVRQSVSLPANVAAQVRGMAKTRRLSSNRMLVELIENGIETEKRKQEKFFELAGRFRDATDPEKAKRLGDELGRMVFGD
jgi:hypothetical protein